MDKKEIQKQRVKDYFIEAAKEIVLKEGVQQVSVRKVADKAGYSYATIYNYFENLDQLLWHVGVNMLTELHDDLEAKIDHEIETGEDLKEALRYYVNYFFNNPNIFTFFFFHQSGPPPKELEEALQRPIMAELMVKALANFVAQGKIAQEHLEHVTKTVIFSLHGMLLMAFSNKANVSKEEIFTSLDQLVDYVLTK